MANDQVSPANIAELKRFAESHRTGYGIESDLCERYLALEAACSQTVQPGPECDGCQSQLPDYFEHRNRCIVTQTVEKEQGRWQQSIYELCRKHAIYPDGIDGGGCDSGDPLDLTLAEVGQVICQLENPDDYLAAPPAVSTPRCPRCHEDMEPGFARTSVDSKSAIKVRCCGNELSQHEFLIYSFTELRQFFQPEAQPSPAFGCAARKQGTAGGNYPQDCDWPVCGCDEKASRVVEALIESGWQSPKELQLAARKLSDRDLLVAGFAYRCGKKGDNIQQMEHLLRKTFTPQPSPEGESK